MADSVSVEALNGEQKRQVEQQNDDLREELVAKSQLSESEQVVELSSSQVVIDELSESRFEALVASPTCTRRIPNANDQCVGSQDNLRLESHVVASELKGQDGISGPNVLESGTGQCAEAQTENQHQSCVCPASLSELSPTSVTQSISSAPSPTLLEPSLSPSKVNNTDACILKADQQNSSKLKSLSLQIGKAHISDGFNWRKYGQKQVKSPKGSRSYYKCTYSDCCAKKIECADHSGHVIEIVNKGMHSHDPPRKNNCTRESKVALSSPPVPGDTITEPSTAVPMDSTTERSTSMLTDSNQSSLSKGSLRETALTPEKKRQNFSGLNENGRILNTEEHISEPEPKRRVKKENLECSGSLPKPGKKPKFVVHAAGDVGISGDGHRWRKYGQKMVKGNPNPRNYYRCTSAGCPVRKHIETAADNTNAVIITYKGVHDHDMPVPKKRHGPPSAPLVAAAAPTSLSNSQLKKTDTLSNQASSTQWSVGKEGELTSEALDLGGEKDKAIESARTLLSIGFEIKPC